MKLTEISYEVLRQEIGASQFVLISPRGMSKVYCGTPMEYLRGLIKDDIFFMIIPGWDNRRIIEIKMILDDLMKPGKGFTEFSVKLDFLRTRVDSFGGKFYRKKINEDILKRLMKAAREL